VCRLTRRVQATPYLRLGLQSGVSGPGRLTRIVKHYMGPPLKIDRGRPFATFLVWSAVIGAVVHYAVFCLEDGIGLEWITGGLVCWGILLSCSEKYLLKIRDLARALVRRFGAL